MSNCTTKTRKWFARARVQGLALVTDPDIKGDMSMGLYFLTRKRTYRRVRHNDELLPSGLSVIWAVIGSQKERPL